MTRSDRNLPTVEDLAVENKLTKGQRIVITAVAGPKLAGTRGVVVGKGTTKSQVRVLLARSRNCITLHCRFVTPADGS
jgi:hypothetical protein